MIIDYLGSCFIYQQHYILLVNFTHHLFTWWEWMVIQLSSHQMGLNLTSFVKIGLERNIKFEVKNCPNCSPYVFEQKNWKLIWKVSLGASKEQPKRKRSYPFAQLGSPGKKSEVGSALRSQYSFGEGRIKSSARVKLVSVSEFRHSRWQSWDGT
jgi:hypothetical protein